MSSSSISAWSYSTSEGTQCPRPQISGNDIMPFERSLKHASVIPHEFSILERHRDWRIIIFVHSPTPARYDCHEGGHTDYDVWYRTGRHTEDGVVDGYSEEPE